MNVAGVGAVTVTLAGCNWITGCCHRERGGRGSCHGDVGWLCGKGWGGRVPPRVQGPQHIELRERRPRVALSLGLIQRAQPHIPTARRRKEHFLLYCRIGKRPAGHQRPLPEHRRRRGRRSRIILHIELISPDPPVRASTLLRQSPEALHGIKPPPNPRSGHADALALCS